MYGSDSCGYRSLHQERPWYLVFFFFQAEDGIRDYKVTGVQTCALPISRAAIEACRNDPLARAVRADKLTLAALEATLVLYRDPERARLAIPVLRMLTEDVAEIRRRGEALQKSVGADAELVEGESEVGGGSFPEAKLPTWLVRVTPDPRHLTPDTLSARLRAGDPPIVARIGDDRVLLDPRTIFPDQVETVARAVRSALDG